MNLISFLEYYSKAVARAIESKQFIVNMSFFDILELNFNEPLNKSQGVVRLDEFLPVNLK